MRSVYWLAGLLALALVLGLLSGFAAIFIAPIAGALLIVAVVVLMARRRTEGKPPLDPSTGEPHARVRR